MSAQPHPFAFLRHRADVLKCCADAERNLIIIDAEQTTPGVTVARCKQCGRRHRKMRAELGSVIGKSLQEMAMTRKPAAKLILPGDPLFKA